MVQGGHREPYLEGSLCIESSRSTPSNMTADALGCSFLASSMNKDATLKTSEYLREKGWFQGTYLPTCVWPWVTPAPLNNKNNQFWAREIAWR